MDRGSEIGHQNSTSSKPKHFTELHTKNRTLDKCFFCHIHFGKHDAGIISPLDK